MPHIKLSTATDETEEKENQRQQHHSNAIGLGLGPDLRRTRSYLGNVELWDTFRIRAIYTNFFG